jgi:hypothetical protein
VSYTHLERSKATIMKLLVLIILARHKKGKKPSHVQKKASMTEAEMQDLRRKLVILLVFVVTVAAVFVYLNKAEESNNRVIEPDRKPDVSGLVDEWKLVGGIAQAYVEVEKGDFRYTSFFFDQNSKIGRGMIGDFGTGKPERSIGQGNPKDIRDNMLIEVYFNVPGHNLVDTLVYW